MANKKITTEEDGFMPSWEYRAMIYFAVTTFFFYQKDIITNPKMTVHEFRQKNPELVKRVFDEADSIFGYELSYEQMRRAILSYLQGKYYPKSVYETEVYKLNQQVEP